MKALEAVGALLRAAFRITALFVWLFLSIATQLLGFILQTGDGRHLRMRFYRGALRILGIRIRTFGALNQRRPLLVVANHVSYLDVLVLGSLIPCRFVAKDDVRAWPVIGALANIQQTLFIARDPRRPRAELSPIVTALNQGQHVVVFPEGTSTDGSRVISFKSTLFEAAKLAHCHVQPVSLVYRNRHGTPLSAHDRALYTWGTEAPFLWHFMQLILRPGVLIEVWFRPTIEPSGSRKQIRDLAFRRVHGPIRHRARRSLSD